MSKWRRPVVHKGAATTTPRPISGGGSGILFMDLTLPKGAAVPKSIGHRFDVEVAKTGGAQGGSDHDPAPDLGRRFRHSVYGFDAAEGCGGPEVNRASLRCRSGEDRWCTRGQRPRPRARSRAAVPAFCLWI